MYTRICLASLMFACSNNATYAQQFSTVQLPTYQRFSMSTTLLVPDQGRIYAGGINQSSHASNRFGNSNSVSAGGVTVSAFVHDFEAMDAAVLEQGRQARLRSGQDPAFRVSRSNVPAPFHTSIPTLRVGDVRRRTAATDRNRQRRAQADFDLAQRLLKKGKTTSGRTMLKNAAKRADGVLKSLVLEQLAELNRIPTGVVATKSSAR